ncbi:MAG: ABC-F family ATP-binding cassette domain-containing protein [Eubacteriales bacterium]
MIDISVSHLSHEFEVGEKILDDITFQIDSGQKVGLLGKNGTGKTTLLKILTGTILPDEGDVVLGAGKRVGLISQIPQYPQENTVEQVLDTAFAPLKKIEQELQSLTLEMEQNQTDTTLLTRYDTLTANFERLGGYQVTTMKNKVCNGLTIPETMRSQKFASLSGGEKTRVNLARLILEDTDILLLDEPTNHLDLKATLWLEEYLDKFIGTVLIVSHDRYFLDKVVGRVIELSRGQAEFYSGNYTFYAVEKEQRAETQRRQYEKEQAKVAQLEATARVMHERGTERMHKQAFAMEKRMARIAQTQRPTAKERGLKVRFDAREFKGDEVLSIKGLEKSFDGRTLFSNVNFEVAGGERIAILGDNGAGKSTLVKIILKEEHSDQGRLRFGPTVKLGYLPQHVHFDHPERSLVDTLIYDLNATAQSARNRLGSFQFSGDDVFKPVSALSGGEQSRLRLCMLMDEKINLLVLDEPTNHLDILSREWIEEAVEDFEGNLLFVSHDRYFIDRFATRIWWIHEGEILDFKGDYQSFLAKSESFITPPTPKAVEKKEKPKRTGGTKHIEKERNTLERTIAKLEEGLQEIAEQITQSSTDYQALEGLYASQNEQEQALEQAYDRWEALSQEIEELAGNP